MSQQHIRLRGVNVHNLRDVDLDLARRQMIVFCGVSGSGKTSLALDTLYAEGQRRYLESFSTYTRQFLEQLEKPDAESIEGLPPAVAVTHKNPSRSRRATVGTATEVHDYLALLFARVGTTVCRGCGRPVRRDRPEAVREKMAAWPEATRAMIAFESAAEEGEPADEWLGGLVEAGYRRALVDGEQIELGGGAGAALGDAGALLVVLDRVTTGRTAPERIYESLEAALAAGRGRCVLLAEGAVGQSESDFDALDSAPMASTTLEIDGRTWQRHSFSMALRCDACGIDYADPEPQLFSFNSPLGACPECEGFGNILRMDMDLVVSDRGKTLRQGAIVPWNTPAYKHELEELLELADVYDLPVDVPFEELTEVQQQLVHDGVPERNFGGLKGFFRSLERHKNKVSVRAFLSRWRSPHPCQACGGTRLRPEALAVKLDGHSIADISRLKIGEAAAVLQAVRLEEWQQSVARGLLRGVTARLSYLAEVGVGYLTLDRPMQSLSSGEAQRVALTSTLGSVLVDLLYVLDEPSIGLHPANVAALTTSIERLRDRGNTVVVVEHEEEIIRRADDVVEVGPGAGDDGGQIVFHGTPAEMQEPQRSYTGDWVAGRRGGPPERRRATERGWLRLAGASGHNLHDVIVAFPLGVLCMVTGVSGAGKSTLVGETLYPALIQLMRLADGKTGVRPPLPYLELSGSGELDDVVRIDHSPIGRSPRSNPVTYVKAFDMIRQVFADQTEARTRGFVAGHFSFNVEGGRCEACRGDGYIAVDMQFMADVYMKCSECEGRRYRREVLAVKYRGHDIAEVLDMTARQAFSLFRGHKKVLARLKCLIDVGLEYLRLGQPANTLSGGEAQRLKLAKFLAARRRDRTLFVLDEPTTGLHFRDIIKLLDCFDSLLDVGHSLVVVEHNVQLMQAADYIIDIGPGAAEEGGRVVAAGTPEEVAACGESVTGRYLAPKLVRGEE